MDFDVVIIGGGIVGSSIAYFLAANPAFDGDVCVVERDPSYQRCSTAFATGVIRPQFSTPANIRMSLWSFEFIRSARTLLSTDSAPCEPDLREHGYMILVMPSAQERFKKSHAAQIANGADVVFFDAQTVARRFPLIATDGIAGAYFSATKAGSFDPWALLHGFRRKAQSLGVIYIHDEVVGLGCASGLVTRLRLSQGQELHARCVVNAAGARDAARVAEMAGVELPVEPRKRTTFYVACNEDLRAMPMFILPSGVWVRPEGKGFLCGLTPRAERDAACTDFELDYDQFEEDIWPRLAETVPAFEAVKLISAYCGHYDFNTLDENAILGSVPQLPNFFIATGFSGHGAMHSPAAGRLISDLITHGVSSEIDSDVFGYERVLSGRRVVELNVF